MTSEDKISQAIDALAWISDNWKGGDGAMMANAYSLIYSALGDLESALHSVEAEKEPEWIRCEERFPSAGDADCTGMVLTYGRESSMGPDASQFDYWPWSDVANGIAYRDCGVTHWMPTGLRRPEPPEHKPE